MGSDFFSGGIYRTVGVALVQPVAEDLLQRPGHGRGGLARPDKDDPTAERYI